jgi:hypothetical protein
VYGDGDGQGGRYVSASGVFTLAHNAGTYALLLITLLFFSSYKAVSFDPSASSSLWLRCALVVTDAPLYGLRLCWW